MPDVLCSPDPKRMNGAAMTAKSGSCFNISICRYTCGMHVASCFSGSSICAYRALRMMVLVIHVM